MFNLTFLGSQNYGTGTSARRAQVLSNCINETKFEKIDSINLTSFFLKIFCVML